MEVKASGSIELAPKGNQIAVTLIFIIAALFFAGSVWLEAQGKSYYLSAGVGFSFLTIGFIFWWKSHKNESLQKAHPFSLKVGEGNKAVEVSADARSLPALDYLKGILGHYSVVFHREALPQPSGTIDKAGNPIDGTLELSQSIVNDANEVAQQQANKVAQDIYSRVQSIAPVATASPVIDNLTGASAPD
ncbi:hypothetical protein ACEN2T_14970 [Pseudomonas sp. W22_MBD1_FP4]|uniref:hypothetical protein n=1 Tax=Pseudomonas sp. W22_MBD1_FP4 TaxID=3240272 RepID=UPI003F9996D9